MPLLPSGLKLALLADHIMEPDRNWFKAPEGHFWYWTPAEDNSPPFSPDSEYENVPATAPVPTTRAMVERYIRVCIGLDDGRMYWRGEMLSEFPKYGALSEKDNKAWREWLDTDNVKKFLDAAIVKCQTQAEINKEAIGYAVFRDVVERDDGRTVGKKLIDDPTKDNH